jgi:hypothetical protein
MSNSSEAIAAPAGKVAVDDDYYTYVEDVGNIPRDIYKLVESDPRGDLPRYSVHIVIQHLLVLITFLGGSAAFRREFLGTMGDIASRRRRHR